MVGHRLSPHHLRSSGASGRRRQGLVVGVAVAAVSLTLAACGSSGSGSGAGSSPSGATSGGSTQIVAQASSLLSNAASQSVTGPSTGKVGPSQIVPWSASLMPTPLPLTKTPVTIDVVYAIPVGFTVYTGHLIQAMGQQFGWKVKVIVASANSQPASLAAMQSAVLDKPTAIIAAVIPGVWVGPALQRAKAEHIITIDMDQDSTTGPGYDAWTPDAESVQKTLVAAYAVQQSKGTAKSILVSAPGFSDAWITAAQDYLSTCSSCKTTLAQFNPTDLTDPIKTESDVTSKLAATSGVNYIVWPNGALPMQPVVQAIAKSPSNRNTKLLANDAAPGSVTLVRAGQLPILVYSPSALLPLVAFDDIDRMLAGQQPLAEDALRAPISYWTQQNAPQPTNPAITAAELQAADWLTTFEKAWGVQLKSTILNVAN